MPSRPFSLIDESPISSLLTWSTENSVFLVSFLLFWKYFPLRDTCPTPVLLPGKSHGRRSLVGCSPWGCWELDTTEWLHFHFSLSCTGERNGNPLQCSCLENPRDGEPCGLPSMGSHSRTRLKRLSRSNSKRYMWITIQLDALNFSFVLYLPWVLHVKFKWKWLYYLYFACYTMTLNQHHTCSNYRCCINCSLQR